MQRSWSGVAAKFALWLELACHREAWGDDVARGLMEIGAETVKIAGDGDKLGDGGEPVQAPRVGDLPTEPVYAGGHHQPRGVIGGGWEAHKGSCQGVGFMPPGIIAHGLGLMHVREARGVDAGAEEEEASFRRARWRDPAFSKRRRSKAAPRRCGFRIGRNCFDGRQRNRGG
jgi:hypothetical protein